VSAISFDFLGTQQHNPAMNKPPPYPPNEIEGMLKLAFQLLDNSRQRFELCAQTVCPPQIMLQVSADAAEAVKYTAKVFRALHQQMVHYPENFTSHQSTDQLEQR